MARYEMKITPIAPNEGKEIEVPTVVHVDWSVGRPSGPGGNMGLDGHIIAPVAISRIRSLQDEKGRSGQENEIIKLAAAMGQAAYFKGEIRVFPSDDETTVLKVIRFQRGYISNLSCSVNDHDITEQIQITVADLQVNDASFKQAAR